MVQLGLDECGAESLDAPPIDPQIGSSHSRRGANVDRLTAIADEKLQIVDEAKQETAALGVEVALTVGDDLRALHATDDPNQLIPCFYGRPHETQRLDPLRSTLGQAGYAVRRAGTRSESSRGAPAGDWRAAINAFVFDHRGRV